MSMIVGVSADYKREAKSNYPNEIPLDLVAAHINQAIIKAGGLPFVIPTTKESISRQYASEIDALVLSGGYDVDPSFYGEASKEALGVTCPRRDESELALAEEVIKLGKPVLGICRGMQIINVLYGGNLDQDQSYVEGAYLKHRQETPMYYPIHDVDIKEGSYLSSVVGRQLKVNSLHHQSIKDIGQGLEAVAHAEDGIVEAVEAVDDYQNVLAVQWHPEDLFQVDDRHFALFTDLVKRAEQARR